MASRKIFSVCVGFIGILFVASIIGCGSSKSTPKATYNRVTKIYMGSSAPIPLAGVTVDAVDNETGEPLKDDAGAAITGVSGTDGSISFTIRAEKVAFRTHALTAFGGAANFVEAITSNCTPTDLDPTLFLIEFQQAYLNSMDLVNNLPLYGTLGGQKAVFAATLVWRDANGLDWPAGCATIEYKNVASNQIVGEADYDGDNGFPSATQSATNPNNGKFAGLNIDTGKTIVIAKGADGIEITDPDHPNYINMVKSNDASAVIATAVFNVNSPPLINLSNIWVKQTATPPGAAGCVIH